MLTDFYVDRCNNEQPAIISIRHKYVLGKLCSHNWRNAFWSVRKHSSNWCVIHLNFIQFWIHVYVIDNTIVKITVTQLFKNTIIHYFAIEPNMWFLIVSFLILFLVSFWFISSTGFCQREKCYQLQKLMSELNVYLFFQSDTNIIMILWHVHLLPLLCERSFNRTKWRYKMQLNQNWLHEFINIIELDTIFYIL